MTIVWIATSFSQDHLAALNWLNDITHEQFHFFAVKLEMWTIAGSPPAAQLAVVVRPSDWTRRLRNATQAGLLPPPARTRLEYWELFLSQLKLADSAIQMPQPNTRGNIRFTLRGNDLWTTVYTTTEKGHKRIGVFLVGKTGDCSALKKERRQIEADLGQPLHWTMDEDGTSWRIDSSVSSGPGLVRSGLSHENRVH